eukprot:1960593-Rhodomonas_salina.2
MSRSLSRCDGVVLKALPGTACSASSSTATTGRGSSAAPNHGRKLHGIDPPTQFHCSYWSYVCE